MYFIKSKSAVTNYNSSSFYFEDSLWAKYSFDHEYERTGASVTLKRANEDEEAINKWGWGLTMNVQLCMYLVGWWRHLSENLDRLDNWNLECTYWPKDSYIMTSKYFLTKAKRKPKINLLKREIVADNFSNCCLVIEGVIDHWAFTRTKNID